MESGLVIHPAVPKGAFRHVSKELRKHMIDVLIEAKELLAQHKQEYICYALNNIKDKLGATPLTVAACLRAVEFIDASLGWHYESDVQHTTLGSWIASTDEYASLASPRVDWYSLARLSRPVWIDAIVEELRNV